MNKIFMLFFVLLFISCSQENLDSCLNEATKATTDVGVKVGAVRCYEKFKKQQIDKIAVSEAPKVKDACKVYWDGSAFKLGDTLKDDSFSRFSMSRYNLKIVTFALPNSMAEGFNIKADFDGYSEFKGEFKVFMDRHWIQIVNLCNF